MVSPVMNDTRSFHATRKVERGVTTKALLCIISATRLDAGTISHEICMLTSGHNSLSAL